MGEWGAVGRKNLKTFSEEEIENKRGFNRGNNSNTMLKGASGNVF